MCSRVHGNSNKLSANSLFIWGKRKHQEFYFSICLRQHCPFQADCQTLNRDVFCFCPLTKVCMTFTSSMRNLSGMRNISLKTFRLIWNDWCPHIALGKPETDLCQKCQVYANEISKGGRLDDDDKSKLLAEYDKHITALRTVEAKTKPRLSFGMPCGGCL